MTNTLLEKWTPELTAAVHHLTSTSTSTSKRLAN